MGVIQKQGLRNTIIAYLGILIGFVNVIVVQPHFLSTSELGLVRILFSFSSMVAVILPLGMANITLRFFPHFKNESNGHHGFFGVILLVAFLGFLMIAGLLFIFNGWVKSLYVEESPLFVEFFYCVLPLCFLVSFNSLLSTYCGVLFKTTFPSLVNDIGSRVLFIGVMSLYYIHVLTFTQFVIAFVCIYVVVVLVLLIYIFMIDRPSIKINISKFKEVNIGKMAIFGITLAATSFAGLGIRYIDSIMLGSYLPLSIVGIYSLAAFIPTIVEVPIASLEKITNPKISDEWAKNNLAEVSKIYKESTKYLMIFGGILLLGVTINIRSLMSFLPSDFSLGINVVFILSVSTFFNMLTGLNSSVLFYSKYYKQGSLLLVVLLATTIVANMIFIPIYGMEGAALATALASFLFNLAKYLFILFEMKMQPFDITSIYGLLLIAFCFGINYLIPFVYNPVVDIIVRSFVISLIYITVVYKMKIIPELNKFAARIGL